MASKINLNPPSDFGCCLFLGGVSAVVYSFFVVAPIVYRGLIATSLFCFAVLCILSSFAIFTLGKGELVDLLLLRSECMS